MVTYHGLPSYRVVILAHHVVILALYTFVAPAVVAAAAAPTRLSVPQGERVSLNWEKVRFASLVVCSLCARART